MEKAPGRLVLRKTVGAFSAGTEVFGLDHDANNGVCLVVPHCARSTELHVPDDKLVTLRPKVDYVVK